MDSSARDPEALLAHARALHCLAFDVLHDAQLAEDVVQETYLRALSARERPRTLLAWLRSITRNLAIDRWREERRRTVREQSQPEPNPAPSSLESLQRLDLQRGLLDAIQRLPEPYRAVVLLRYFDGLEPIQIARRQGIPAATVRTRVRRALVLLRKELDERAGGRRAWALALLASVPPSAGPRRRWFLGAAGAALFATAGLFVTAPWSGRGPLRADGSERYGAAVAETPGRAAVEPTAPTVSGRVIDERGRPAPGVVVSTRSAIPRLPPRVDWRAPASAVLRTVRTAHDGTFSLPGPRVPAVVHAAAADAVSGMAPLDAGTRREGLVLRLERTRRCVVHVVDELGHPLAGARARLRGGFLGGHHPYAGAARGDAAGRIEFAPLPPASYALVVEAAGYVAVLRPWVRLPASSVTVRMRPAGPSRAGRVRDAAGLPVPAASVKWIPTDGSSAGGEATTDAEGRFQVAATPRCEIFYFADAGARGVGFACRSEIVLERPRTVRGRLRQLRTGRPLAGVRVVAVTMATAYPRFARDGREARVALAHGLRTVLTDATGSFAFVGLPETARLRVGFEEAERYAFDVPVYVEPGSRARLRLSAVDRPLLRGTVQAAGSPVVAARVTQSTGTGVVTFTDRAGRFFLRARPSSNRAGFQRVRMRVEAPGFRVARLLVHDWQPPVVSLVAAPSIERPRSESVTGDVRIELVDEADAPVVRASVLFRQPEGETVALVSDESGVAAGRIGLGRHRLAVRAGQFAPFLNEEFLVTRTTHARIVLRAGEFISGSVLDAAGGAVADAEVRVVADRQIERTRSGNDGRFRIGGLPDGGYRVVTLARIGGAPAWAALNSVGAGDDIVLRLPAAAVVAGRVLWRDDRPAAGAPVTLRIRAPLLAGSGLAPWPVTASSGPDGGFRLPLHGGAGELLVDWNRIEGRRSSHGMAGRSIPIDRTRREWIVRPPVGESIDGIVRTPDGRPAMSIVVRALQNGETARVVTDSRGRFSFGGLRAGRCEIRCAGASAPLGDGAHGPAWFAKLPEVPVGTSGLRIALQERLE